MLTSSWNARFFNQYRKHLTVPSLFRYRAAMLREQKLGPRYDERIWLTIKRPARSCIVMRPATADHCTFSEIFLDQIYSSVLQHVADAETIIDLGANIGLAALYFAGHFPRSSLMCVEPDATNYELLVANLSKFITTNRCRTLRAALWDAKVPLVMNPLDGAGRTNAGTLRECDPSVQGSEVVPGLPIAEIIRTSGFDHVDLLKVDVEGAETPLFAGDRSWLDQVGAIAIEFHGESRRESDFGDAILDAGLSVRESGRHTVVATRQ
jgi:FkbM family methyltransferase